MPPYYKAITICSGTLHNFWWGKGHHLALPQKTSSQALEEQVGAVMGPATPNLQKAPVPERQHYLNQEPNLLLEVLTLPKTNTGPKNGGCQQESPFQGSIFRGYVSFRGVIMLVGRKIYQTCKFRMNLEPTNTFNFLKHWLIFRGLSPAA